MVPYSGLLYNQTYTLTINSGSFSDLAGNRLVTTEPGPKLPAVSPKNLSIATGKTGSFSVTFGQGSATATEVTISVSDDSKVSVTPETLTAFGT